MKHIILFLLIFSIIIVPGVAVGIIKTIDTGYYNADEMKQPVSFKEKEWANGTYSNTRLEPGGVVTFDIRDRITMSATLTLTPSNGVWKWYPANQTGNTVSYQNALATISYTDWDTILKEQIVLNAPVSSISWQINLSVKPQTLTVTIDGDDYLIKDPANKNEWIRVRRPFVVDAKGVKRTLRYTWNNGQRRLTLVQDFSGLTYPLTIDPVYVVDTTGTTGMAPQIIVNQSNIPQIVYFDGANAKWKLAANSSGTWSFVNLYPASSGIGTYSGVALNTANDLPILVAHGSLLGMNISWNVGGKWVSCETQYSQTSVIQKHSDTPIGYDSSSGRVLIFDQNNTYGNPNITWIESLASSTPVAYKRLTLKGIYDPQIMAQSGKMNASHVLNVVYGISGGSLNWTTATSSTTPIMNTVNVGGYPFFDDVSFVSLSLAINPTTDFPAFASTATTNPQAGALNYSYFSGTRWYYETAYKNTTSAVPPSVNVALAFNSSGTPYIVFNEKMGGYSTYRDKMLKYTKRISPGVWSTPVDLMGDVYAYPPAIAFDHQDGLHIAWYNETYSGLYYYFEALPAAPPGAPVAAFACTPLSGCTQNMVCTDSSTNTPTSWSWNVENQTGTNFKTSILKNPIFSMTFPGTYNVNLSATNAGGTDWENKTGYATFQDCVIPWLPCALNTNITVSKGETWIKWNWTRATNITGIVINNQELYLNGILWESNYTLDNFNLADIGPNSYQVLEIWGKNSTYNNITQCMYSAVRSDPAAVWWYLIIGLGLLCIGYFVPLFGFLAIIILLLGFYMVYQEYTQSYIVLTYALSTIIAMIVTAFRISGGMKK